MSNKRREFLKNVSGSVATVTLGGMSFSSCISASVDGKSNKPSNKEQILEVSENGAIVETKYGKLRGYRRNGIYTYKGIPYGASTTGKSRFMAPKEPEPWNGVRNALVWGNAAPAEAGLGDPFEPNFDHMQSDFTFSWGHKRFGEDCLSVNVWTPEINDNIKRPVLVWFHGGGFAGGSSHELDAYIGENLSRIGDVVVVTVNHRLNLFGFLNLGVIGGEKYKDSATAGMQDCVAALKWVNENISNFGGDPGNVTIFGQSGGGAKVSILMAMPAAKGLFHKAMTISGAALRVSSYDAQAETASKLLKAVGISPSQVDKLQDIPWRDLMQLTRTDRAIGHFAYSPCLDNLHIPQHPFDPAGPAISAGIPMIIGSCTGEQSHSGNDPSLEDITFEELKEKLRNEKGVGGFFGMPDFGNRVDEVIDAYAKVFPQKKPVAIWSLLGGRNRQLEQVLKQTENGGAVYNYWFDWATPLFDGRPRAYHNSDLAFWFNNTDIMETITGGGARPQRLAEKMSLALVNFARTGDPNHKEIPFWPKYDTENGAVMIWNDTCEVRNDPDRAARNLANEIRKANS